MRDEKSMGRMSVHGERKRKFLMKTSLETFLKVAAVAGDDKSGGVY